jgi:hypothetical protein
MNSLHKTTTVTTAKWGSDFTASFTAEDLPKISLEMVAFDENGHEEQISSVPLLRYVDDLKVANGTDRFVSRLPNGNAK